MVFVIYSFSFKSSIGDEIGPAGAVSSIRDFVIYDLYRVTLVYFGKLIVGLGILRINFLSNWIILSLTLNNLIKKIMYREAEIIMAAS